MKNLDSKHRVILQSRHRVSTVKNSVTNNWIANPTQPKHPHPANKAELRFWQNQLIYGYNLSVMATLLVGDEQAPSLHGKTDLIDIAPPFDSKADYRTPITLPALTNNNNMPWIVK